ncbi:Tubulin polyglutamylase complex subunit 2 [Geranomyces variabilis]|nr:Tubulin polyglutamylase complex subunit 2 [Geranomyces variabilis]
MLSQKRPAAVLAATSNLLSYLETCPHVTDIKLSSNPPCSDADLQNWALMNVPHVLPADAAALLRTTDGLKIQWGTAPSSPTSSPSPRTIATATKVHAHAPTESVEIGRVEINALRDWQRIPDATDDNLNNSKPPGTAYFIEKTPPHGHTCLVFLPCKTQQDEARIEVWFHDTSTRRWHFLAASFAAYVRLMVVHLGVRGWQLGWTERGMPQATMDWLAMYAQARVEGYRKARAARNWKQSALPGTSSGTGGVPFDAVKVKQLVAAAKVAGTPPVKADKPAAVQGGMKRPVTR